MKTNWTAENPAASWLVLPEDQKITEAVQFVAQQAGIDPNSWKDYPWQDRSWERSAAV